MIANRLLLPFAGGINAKAIDSAIRFARASQATLVALALINLADTPSESVRPEHIQQAEDFLALIQTKARFSHISVECHRHFTHNAGTCTLLCAQQLNCQGILILSNGKEPTFLTVSEAEHIQQARRFSLYLLEPPAKTRSKSLSFA